MHVVITNYASKIIIKKIYPGFSEAFSLLTNDCMAIVTKYINRLLAQQR